MKRDGCAVILLTTWVLWVLIGLMVSCMFMSFGCATSQPCVPDLEIQEVEKEVRCFVDIDFPPPPEYEEYPAFDSENAKDWGLEVERITQVNRAKSRAWIYATLALLEEHNRLEPQCKQQ